MSNHAGRGTPDAWGIVSEYEDALGTWHRAKAETRRSIIQAMGGDPDGAAPAERDMVRVIHAGESPDLGGAGEILLEAGGSVTVAGQAPQDLPTGYHELVRADGTQTRLIVSPGRCFLPPDLRTWGWAAQLYATRSRQSWGIGDLGDLRELGRWSAGLGA